MIVNIQIELGIKAAADGLESWLLIGWYIYGISVQEFVTSEIALHVSSCDNSTDRESNMWLTS